jgi:hypothetical protein
MQLGLYLHLVIAQSGVWRIVSEDPGTRHA